MLEWYWGLSGITWLLTTLLMGGATIGLIGVIVIGCAKSIAKSFDHDPQTCTCYSCELRRARALNRQAKSSKRPNATIVPGGLVTTNQLELGMVVMGQKENTQYRFEGKQQRGYGTAVCFKNIITGRLSWIVIPRNKVDDPMWKVADMYLRRVYGL